jgi:hypothetical protein
MGRIERPPGWILKYKERIEKEEMTVDEILEDENKIRETPIKISSVTRAINAMGLPITGLRSEKRGKSEGAEVEGEAEGTIESGRTPEEIERGPGWLQRYHERIKNGTITVEGILEEENKIRAEPIKIATVKRAVNAMGYPITGMRSEQQDALTGGDVEGVVETGGAATGADKGPGWLRKYSERIEKGEITVDEILEEENKIRTVPIKRSSVTRAVNAMGYPITGMHSEQQDALTGGDVEGVVETGGAATGADKGPGWLRKYSERIEKEEITVDEILEEENKIRAVPIKRSSVTRAVNAMGHPITGMHSEQQDALKEGKEGVKPKKTGLAEAVAYSSNIGKLSESTLKRFNAIKKSWEADLDKTLQNDYFVNILLALAKLAEHSKSLAPVKS